MSFVLFDIPIYHITESLFDRKIDLVLKKYKEALSIFPGQGLTLKDLGYYDWKYNAIIGYVEIEYSNGDINFSIYLCNKKRYVFNSNKKNILSYHYTVGLHFYAKDLNNSEIKSKIISYLEFINNEYIKKSWYFDTQKICNLLDYINFEEIIIGRESISVK